MSIREVIARAICEPLPEHADTPVSGFNGAEWVVLGPRWEIDFGKSADAILSALDAAGLQVRPKEPTKEMIHAGAIARHSTACDGGFNLVGVEQAIAAYRAMNAAWRKE